jgi:hypothetical protein
VYVAVLVNGVSFTKATRRRVGFVLQDDVLYESLTVKVRRFCLFAGFDSPGCVGVTCLLHQVDSTWGPR